MNAMEVMVYIPLIYYFKRKKKILLINHTMLFATSGFLRRSSYGEELLLFLW